MEARRFKDLERTPDPSRKDMVRLEVSLGPEVFGRYLVTEGGALVFGSTLDADVPVDEPELDGHLVFRLESGTLRIAGRGRLRINGVGCQAAQLLAGDRIEVGRLVFVVARVTVEDPLADRPSAVCPRCRRSVPVTLAEAGGKLHTSCGCSGRVSGSRQVPVLGGDPRKSGFGRSAPPEPSTPTVSAPHRLRIPGWRGEVTAESDGFRIDYSYRVLSKDAVALAGAWPGLMTQLSTFAEELRRPRPHWCGLDAFSLDSREIRISERAAIRLPLIDYLEQGKRLEARDGIALTRALVEFIDDFDDPGVAPEIEGEAIFFDPEKRRFEFHGLMLATIDRVLLDAPGGYRPYQYERNDPKILDDDLISLREGREPERWRISLGRLGVILYRGLTGERPFKGKTLRKRFLNHGELIPIRETGVEVSAPIAMLIERFIRELRKNTFKHFKEVQSLVRTIDSLMPRT